MSTNSSISIETEKGKGKTIYCHWDGYPSHNGKILKENYNTHLKVLALIGLGNISVLGETIGEKVKFEGFDSNKHTPSQCLAYGRDRGETDQEARDFRGTPNDTLEYNYLFKDGEWFVAKHESRFVPLTDEMVKDSD